jgi:hypothetical protein
MPDTTRAIWAIRGAYGKRVQVNGGLSMAELQLQAAGGRLQLDEGENLPVPADSPAWIEHARDGLAIALAACYKLQAAIEQAQAEVAKLGGLVVTCRHCEAPIVACGHHPHPLCKGWFHASYEDQPVIGHCCQGRSINQVAEPASEAQSLQGADATAAEWGLRVTDAAGDVHEYPQQDEAAARAAVAAELPRWNARLLRRAAGMPPGEWTEVDDNHG